MKLMTHIVAGYPTMKESEKIAVTMSKAGVSFIEIQFPFSDPIADGKTILEANAKSIANGTTTQRCFNLLEKIKRKIKTPILVMTYFNIAYNYGLENFCKKLNGQNVYGVIIPDVPIEESRRECYFKLCKKYNLHPIQIISPITPSSRLKKIADSASGFVYCVSSFGTTGERKNINPCLKKYINKVKRYIKTPIALGFGISNKTQAQTASQYADIVVIGSKIINLYKKEKKLSSIKNLLMDLSSAGIPPLPPRSQPSTSSPPRQEPSARR